MHTDLPKAQLINILNSAGINYIVKYKSFERNSHSFVCFIDNKNQKPQIKTAINKFKQIGTNPYTPNKHNEEIYSTWMNFNSEILEIFGIQNQKPNHSLILFGHNNTEQNITDQIRLGLYEISKEIKSGFYGVVPLTMYHVR